jgi:hypothetical protein
LTRRSTAAATIAGPPPKLVPQIPIRSASISGRVVAKSMAARRSWTIFQGSACCRGSPSLMPNPR